MVDKTLLEVIKMSTWTKTEYPGVYVRFHPTRKHGVKRDTYFAIAYRLQGKKVWEVLGWASEGNTAREANEKLAELKKNQRTGEGPLTLQEKRENRAAADKIRQAQAEKEELEALTFSDFWEAHYWPLQESHKAEGSKIAEKSLYNQWIKPTIGDKRLSELAPFDLERLKAAMLKGTMAPASVKYAFAVVSQLWTLARRDGFVAGDCPTRKVKLPVIDNKRLRHLTPSEANTLLEKLKARTPQSHDMAVLALFAGMRFGEIAALTWHDVDLAGAILTIRDPKGKQNRRAFISKPVREVLERRAAKEKTGLVFKDAKGGRMARVSNVYREIANDLFNEGVTDPRHEVTFHTLRHTYASWLVERGTSLYAVKELMGHADFKMTQRYSHLAPDGLRAAALAIEDNLTNNAEEAAADFVALASANEKGSRK